MLRSRDKAVSIKIEGTRKDHVCYYNSALLAEDGRHNRRRVSAVARRSGEALRQYRSIQDPTTDHDRVVRIEPHGTDMKFCRRLQLHHRHRPSFAQHRVVIEAPAQQTSSHGDVASQYLGESRRRSHDAAIETHGPIF